MSSDKSYDKKKQPLIDSDLEEGGSETGSGSGGQGGKIEFHDFLSTGANLRDDTLPFEEEKRLLSNHKDIHELKVKQQKDKRQQYKDLKDGKVPLKDFREGLRASGMSSQFKTNPELADKAQFSGIDKQVNPSPPENDADTNPEQRDELQNELRYRLGYQPTPTFNPKPHGPG
jgi:hypothetical protein